MPTYIALINWTAQGIANVKDSPQRLDAGREAFKKLGVEIKAAYCTMGRYDLVCVMEAPDDETMTACAIKLSSLGNVKTQTMRAYRAAEMDAILSKVK